MSKMSRHSIRKNLIRIQEANFRLTHAAKNDELKGIYRDIAYISKIILILEKQGPTIGKDVEIEMRDI